MGQLVQIVGSLLILAAFTAAQRGRLDQNSVLYLGLNLAGSAVLAVEAEIERQWGFVLLEGVWGLVSFAGLVRVLWRPATPPRG